MRPAMKPLIRRLSAVLTVLGTVSLASFPAHAGWFLQAMGSASAACGSPSNVSKNLISFPLLSARIITISTGALTASGVCPSGKVESATFTATAGPSIVSGSVQSMNAIASAGAEYEDDVTLLPPPGFTGSGVTFGIIDNATITLNAGNHSYAESSLALNVPAFSQDINFVANTFLSGNGTFTDLLQTGAMTFVSCPCTTEFSLNGSADANGVSGSASFSDPVSFILPSGWTYTLASQQTSASAVPEGSSLLLTLTAFALWKMRSRKRAGVEAMTSCGGEAIARHILQPEDVPVIRRHADYAFEPDRADQDPVKLGRRSSPTSRTTPLRRACVLCAVVWVLGWGASAPAAESRIFVGSDTFKTAILPTNRVGCPATTSVSTDDAGSGNASLLGHYTFSAGECINLSTLEVGLGFFTLTAADGSTITGNYAGTAQYTDNTKTSLLYAVSGFITEGTGRFGNLTTGTVAWLGGATFTSATTATGFDRILAGDLYFAK